MRVLIITPRQSRTKVLNIPDTFGVEELGNVVHGAVTALYQEDVYQDEGFLMLGTAEAERKAFNINPLASVLAGEEIFGRVIIIGLKGKTWRDLPQYQIDNIRAVRWQNAKEYHQKLSSIKNNGRKKI